MTQPRGNKNSGAEIEARRAAIAHDLAATGTLPGTKEEYADLVGISRATLWRDLQALEVRFVEGSEADVRQFKAAQLAALLRIESAIADGSIPSDVGNALVRVRDSVARLLGLNEPERKLVGHVNVDNTGRFHQTVVACAGLDDEQYAEVLAFARSLPRKILPMPAGPPPLMLENQ